MRKMTGMIECPYMFLPWDSEHFKCRIARLKPSTLTAELLSECIDWCRREKIDCIYWLAQSDHAPSIRIAENNRFNLVDCRMTLEHRPIVPSPDKCVGCRVGTAADIP